MNESNPASQSEQTQEQLIAQLPSIKLIWDENTQVVGLEFNSAQFRNWDFVIAMLGMAKLRAQDMREQAKMLAMMKEQQQAAQAQRQAQRQAQLIKRQIMPAH